MPSGGDRPYDLLQSNAAPPLSTTNIRNTVSVSNANPATTTGIIPI